MCPALVGRLHSPCSPITSRSPSRSPPRSKPMSESDPAVLHSQVHANVEQNHPPLTPQKYGSFFVLSHCKKCLYSPFFKKYFQNVDCLFCNVSLYAMESFLSLSCSYLVKTSRSPLSLRVNSLLQTLVPFHLLQVHVCDISIKVF